MVDTLNHQKARTKEIVEIRDIMLKYFDHLSHIVPIKLQLGFGNQSHEILAIQDSMLKYFNLLS